MNASQKMIIQVLNHVGKKKTAKQFADDLQISVRSVRNYIHQINDSYPSLITASHQGYELNQDVFTKYKDEFEVSLFAFPQSPKERLTYIIHNLIQHPSKSLHIFDLSETLFVSEQTIRKDLTKVKEKVEQFELNLTTENYIIRLEGTEKNKRKLLTSILYTETSRNFLNIDSLQYHFKQYNIQLIKKDIEIIFSGYHYFINDYAMMNLILHLLVAMDRISINHMVHDTTIKNLEIIRQHELQISREITDLIDRQYHIKFPEQEVSDFALLIMSSTTTLDYNQINNSNLSKYVSDDIILTVKELISSLNKFYDIPLQEEQFFIRFTLHINNLFRRLHANISNKNPLTESIKKNCPLIYDCAVHMSHILQENHPITISDDEIAYIAIHIGGAIETQKNLDTKVKCILYCPQYYDFNMNIIEKLSQSFHDSLIVQHIITSSDELKDIETDFIITTIPMEKYYEFPIITIQPFLTQKDILLIDKTIHSVKYQKKKSKFSQQLLRMTHPKFFSVQTEMKTITDCISFLTGKLLESNIVDEHFSNDIWEREKLSSTAFGQVAIPHTMKMNANETIISILISPEGIQWNDTHKVKIVFMLSTSKKDRQYFGDLFETLSIILSRKDVIEKVIQMESLDEVTTFLIEQVPV